MSLLWRSPAAAARTLCTLRPEARLNKPKLALYSKPGCCLCDGLKEKLQAAMLLGGDSSISHVQLEVRDITTNASWENAFQYEIPVLAFVKEDGTEELIPRMSMRITVEQLQRKMSSILETKRAESG